MSYPVGNKFVAFGCHGTCLFRIYKKNWFDSDDMYNEVWNNVDLWDTAPHVAGFYSEYHESCKIKRW